MPISKEKKGEIFAKLQTVSKAKSLVFVNFHGLTVKDVTELRRTLRQFGVSYLVAKKSLTKKVFGAAGIAGTIPNLLGELGIAWSEDLLAPARETFIFQKKFENRVSLLGGVFEGKFLGMEEMKVIAMIPPLQTLRAQFVNVINSPIQGFVMALNEISNKKV